MEPLACQKTYSFTKKIGCFCKANFYFYFLKTSQLIVEWGGYLETCNSSLSKTSPIKLFLHIFGKMAVNYGIFENMSIFRVKIWP